MNTVKIKSGMSPMSVQGFGGHFGLKKTLGATPLSEIKKEDDKKDFVDSEVKEGQEISSQDMPLEQTPLQINREDMGVSESFECGVCGKEFSARVALVGHMRSHNKKNKEVIGE